MKIDVLVATVSIPCFSGPGKTSGGDWEKEWKDLSQSPVFRGRGKLGKLCQLQKLMAERFENDLEEAVPSSLRVLPAAATPQNAPDADTQEQFKDTGRTFEIGSDIPYFFENLKKRESMLPFFCATRRKDTTWILNLQLQVSTIFLQ